MSNYGKYMKHWRNHRKDRYNQQCATKNTEDYLKQEEFLYSDDEMEGKRVESFIKIYEKKKELSYPVFLSDMGGFFHLSSNPSFSTEIKNENELEYFKDNYL